MKRYFIFGVSGMDYDLCLGYSQDHQTMWQASGECTQKFFDESICYNTDTCSVDRSFSKLIGASDRLRNRSWGI